MTTYVALLRGVNVGGKNMLKMADLKKQLEHVGLTRVRTYLQSGNVVFESSCAPDDVRRQLEAEIETSFGMSITVVLRTAQELREIIRMCPFERTALAPGQTIQLSLLLDDLSDKHAEWLNMCDKENDEYVVNGKEIYFLFRQSILDSKLAKVLQKLGNAVTTRNWNTMMKLAEMVDG